MFLLVKLIIGAFMIGLTVTIHAFVYDWVLKFVAKQAASYAKIFGLIWKVPLLITVVIMIGAALMLDIWLWAFLFMTVDPAVLDGVEKALYFATTCFTTIGFGDIVLDEDWRILSTVIAINGMLLFGWSTAFLFEIMAKLYEEENNIKKRW